MTNIVLLVRDRYELTRQCLLSLVQYTDPAMYTLTVVDDGSTDFRLLHLLRNMCDAPNAVLVEISNSTHVLGKLKNIGAAVSSQVFGQGDWLYLSDNDVCFTPDWLKKLIEFAEDNEDTCSLFGGQIHPFHDQGSAPPKVLDGPSWLLRWWDWLGVGGFKETAPGVCQSEEYPFCEALSKLESGGIAVIRPFVVYHCGLTNSEGKDAPGRKEREAQKVQGVYYE